MKTVTKLELAIPDLDVAAAAQLRANPGNDGSCASCQCRPEAHSCSYGVSLGLKVEVALEPAVQKRLSPSRHTWSRQLV